MMEGEDAPASTLRKRNVAKNEPPPVPETLTRRVVRTLKKADMYTKVQTMHSNIITPTPMGAVVSVIVVVILLYLFVGELSSYTKVEYVTNFKIFDVSDKSPATPTGGKLRVTFDVSFAHLPCEFVSVDYLDMFGTHNFNLHNNIKRKSIDDNGDSEDKKTRRGRRLLQLDTHKSPDEVIDLDAHDPPEEPPPSEPEEPPPPPPPEPEDANNDTGNGEPEDANNDTDNGEPDKPASKEEKAGGVYSAGVVAKPEQVGGKPEKAKPKPIGDEVKAVPTAADNQDSKTASDPAEPVKVEKPSFHDDKPEMKIGGVKLKIVDGAGMHEIVEGGDDHAVYDGEVVELDQANWQATISEHEVVMIDFFAPWCIWCQRLAPVWTATAKAISESETLMASTILAKVDCTKTINDGICRKHRVHAYPTLYTYKKGKLLSPRPYHGDRSTIALIKFLTNLPEPAAAEDPKKVGEHASEKSLVKFYNGPAGRRTKDEGDGYSMGDCVGWRQTAGCDPKGDREAWNDQPCTSLIYNRMSGYCECKFGLKTMELGCKHEVAYFTCEEECKKAVKDYIESGHLEAPHASDTQTGLERVNAAVNEFEKNIAERYGGVTNEGDHDVKQGDDHGCTVAGFLEINKVPGSLLFTAASPWHDFASEEVDMSHTVNQFYFDEIPLGGQASAINTVQLRKAFHGADLDLQLNTMRNQTYHSVIGDERKPHISHEHFLKMIETKFSHDRSSKDLHAGFQYTATSHKFSVSEEDGVLPSVRMIFNIDPIGVHITVKPKHWYKFLTSSCAILGGVFTVFGLIDKAIHTMLFTPSGNLNFSPKT